MPEEGAAVRGGLKTDRVIEAPKYRAEDEDKDTLDHFEDGTLVPEEGSTAVGHASQQQLYGPHYAGEHQHMDTFVSRSEACRHA